MAAEVLYTKLQVKENEQLLLLNVPAAVATLFQQRQHNTRLKEGEKYPAVLLFVHTKAELQQFATVALQATEKGGKLWVAYPKKSSAITTDINRDTGWTPITSRGWSGVRQIAIDETWSALRFKPQEEIVSKRQPGTISGIAGKQKERPLLQVPDYLQALLEQHPAEKAFFESLAYTHRKEYLNWITEAKKPETRERRLVQMMEMLKEEKKGRY